MKRYLFIVVCLLVSLTSVAQSEQTSGAPDNIVAVDLGLPSGTRWANMNVGASSPEEFGGYYAWGETEVKNEYSWSNYSHCDGSRETCYSLDGNISGTQYDVAYVKWGANWRMPTFEEIEELVDNCTYSVTVLNSVQVMKLTGPNGNFVYFPFAGYMEGTERKNIGYDSGYYWSGVNPYTDPMAPCMVPSSSGKVFYNYLWEKFLGLTVRPVLKIKPSVPRTFIDLGLPSGTKWANMNVGASRPEEYGKYFAWGETLEKGSYTWDNYMCPEPTCGKPGDPVYDLVGDKADIAGTKLDAATINWGASWNMPTAEQVEELASNCYSSLETIEGVPCRKLISRINGNEIIFPLAGARWYEDFAYEGTLGYYWSSTLRSGGYVSPGRLIVRGYDHGWGWSMGGENDRFCAFPIRPVYIENNMTGDTISLRKFSVVFDNDQTSEMLGSTVTFQRKGNADSYSLSSEELQEYDPNYDISKVSFITRKSIGHISLPESSELSEKDLTITVDGDTISMDENGNYDAIGSTLVATNTEGEIVYMTIASVEDSSDAVGADLNAKESALTLMLPLVPNIFVAFDNEYLPQLKEMIWDVAEVKQLAEAIDRSVIKYGYTDLGEISKEAASARNKLSQLLHLEELAEKQAKFVSMASSKAMIKASGSKESPYIVNPYGYGGLQVEITDSEKKQFYIPYNISGYKCEVTAYNTNRFAYSSMVKGKYDAETNTYYIPDLGDDYEYYKNILKPQKVSTFMDSFTSFKEEDLERFWQFWKETLDPNIGLNEMHWDDMKKTAFFDISEQDDAIVLLFPRGNDYMMVYNIMQSIMKPIVKAISKKASKAFDSEIFLPFVCGELLSDPNYILEVKGTLNDSELNTFEKIDKVTGVTWTKFFKIIDGKIQDKFDDALKDALSDLISESVLKAGSIEAASNWVDFKAAFKMLSWIKKYGDILMGVLGTFFEDNAVYPIHWEANGQFVLAEDAVTVGEGEDINVRILVGGDSYSAESSDEEIATVSGSYNKVKIHGVDAGDAIVSVRDKVAQKTAKINVCVTGIQSFVLAESKVSVPMYSDCSVTIERGDGPFHIQGGNNKIAVAKLGGGNPNIFPGDKYAIVVSGVSEGSTTFEIYNEATDQSLPLEVNVTAEQVAITDERIVDLGLSVNWSNCNVGASSPEEYGDYFAWGEVTPKEYYSLSNYKHYSNGIFKNIGSDISGTEYDAATHNQGNGWRMPTKAEFDELIDNCQWKFVTYRRKRGWKVTGPSGNSIFFPAAGNILNDWNDYASIYGLYWSSNITDNHREVYTLYTTMDDYKMSYSHMNCYEGRTIRAVAKKTVTTLKLSATAITLSPGSQGTVNITSGNGGYSVSVDKPSIATATLSGTKITITGVAAGTAKVTVKDNSGQTAYVNVTVISANELVLSNSVVNITVGSEATVEIISGSGDYSLAIDDSSIATYSLSGSIITVKGIRTGTAVVTVTDNVTKQKKAFFVNVSIKQYPVAEAIDLGLPSGTLWASWNVGASKPEEYGGYYAWGETEEKGYYYWDNYMCEEDECGTTKDPIYIWNGNKLYADIAGSKFDVATSKWGTSWHMPTSAQMEELLYECIWTWCDGDMTKYNGTNVKGYIISSKVNKNKIFLPAAGNYHKDNLLYNNESCLYWSSSQFDGDAFEGEAYYDNSNSAFGMDYNIEETYVDLRFYGQTVRPVCTPEKPQECPVAEAIDLGLPSGTKWASWNVGASAPEEYGGYYAWGETEEKDYYDWSTYKWCKGSDDSFTKYCSLSWCGYNGFTDDLPELLPEDDAATVNWGSPWRMPSYDQINELIDNSTCMSTQQNGVNGTLVTGPNGNTIFLPATGNRYHDGLYHEGEYGVFWSLSYDRVGAYYLFAKSHNLEWGGNYEFRFYGMSIRPVCP